MSALMLGSSPHDYVAAPDTREQLFSVQLDGKTLWGWQRRSQSGAIVALSETLFPDYVACLCDARRLS